MESARARVRIRGSVQGVGFRYSAMYEAERLGLAGWVRNIGWDGVEAVFEGPRADVEAAVEWCREGPRGARVEDVQVAWEPPQGEKGFGVRSSVSSTEERSS